ncbi:MAG: Tfp pilus assembly protein FimT/FimU [Desulfococcaceae bacterium]
MIGNRFGNRSAGYTLIELVVVVAMISLLFFMTLPRFESRLIQDDRRKVIRWIMLRVQGLKQEALRSRSTRVLHLDLDAGRIWVSQEGMDEEALDAARESGYEMPEDVSLAAVALPDGDRRVSGTVDLRFYPGGYSDRAIIQLRDEDHDPISLRIETFLTKVKLYHEAVDFEG